MDRESEANHDLIPLLDKPVNGDSSLTVRHLLLCFFHGKKIFRSYFSVFFRGFRGH